MTKAIIRAVHVVATLIVALYFILPGERPVAATCAHFCAPQIVTSCAR